jgi:hypothetical protein
LRDKTYLPEALAIPNDITPHIITPARALRPVEIHEPGSGTDAESKPGDSEEDQADRMLRQGQPQGDRGKYMEPDRATSFQAHNGREPFTASALTHNESMIEELDLMKKQMKEAAELEGFRSKLIVGTASGIGTSFVAGYVLWAFRGISLFSSALASMPLWRSFDPLPVLSNWRKRDEDDEIGPDEKKNQEDDDKGVREIFEHEAGLNDKED